MEFLELNVNKKIKDAIKDMGFEGMMPIQEQAIPIILNGDNIIGEADTGTGKTAAFLVPLLDKIDFKSGNTECLILTPTRELAMQIVSEIVKIGKYLDISYITLVGGMGMREQISALRKTPSIIVGTLGRINDHLRSKRIDLKHIKYFVLDEADEMLKEGFKDDITTINDQIPNEKQTLLFSATISKQILGLTKTIMDDYTFVSVKNKDKQDSNIDQHYIIMKEKQKFSVLTKLLDIQQPKSAIIFGRTKKRVDELNEALNKCGYKSSGIHGDLSQQQRNSVMKKFRENQIKILVATDVAARGLDISDISHVYNFDLPQEIEFYVHRIGRTGRAMKHGVSYSFVKETELSHVKRIEKEANLQINEKGIPSFEEVWNVRKKDINVSIEQKLAEIDPTKTKEFVADLIEEYGAEKLISVLIESLSKRSDINDISLTGEPPVVSRRNGSDNYNRDRKGGRDRDRRSRGRNDRRPSDNTRPTDRKPFDARPTDRKPTDRKPFDRKPSDRKPSDRKPFDRPNKKD